MQVWNQCQGRKFYATTVFENQSKSLILQHYELGHFNGKLVKNWDIFCYFQPLWLWICDHDPDYFWGVINEVDENVKNF